LNGEESNVWEKKKSLEFSIRLKRLMIFTKTSEKLEMNAFCGLKTDISRGNLVE
jgi:hypothetical protein